MLLGLVEIDRVGVVAVVFVPRGLGWRRGGGGEAEGGILVEVVCESDDDLIDLLNDRIRSLPDVVATETFVYLKLHRQLYNWGTR